VLGCFRSRVLIQYQLTLLNGQFLISELFVDLVEVDAAIAAELSVSQHAQLDEFLDNPRV
jgi:hypothetical protein